MTTRIQSICLVLIVSSLLVFSSTIPGYASQKIKPLTYIATETVPNAIKVTTSANDYADLKSITERGFVDFPISANDVLELDLKPFNIFTGRARILIGDATGGTETDLPDIVILRGHIAGQPQSRVCLGFTSQGSGGGYVISETGETWFMSQHPDQIGQPNGRMIIHKSATNIEPEFEEFCRAIMPDDFQPHADKFIGIFSKSAGGPRVAEVALEADETFCDIFPNNLATQQYIALMMGVISDIYLRDLDVRLMISFLRLWPDGNEPFPMDDLAAYRDYWWAHEDDTGLNVVHLLTAQKDFFTGGIGYVGGTCSGHAYSMSGYLNGYFPLPAGIPNAGNWDVTVVAHEIGHNFYGLHTHDEYFPDTAIDHCATAGIFQRSTIMSYCHTSVGYTSNLDLRFHRLVQEYMEYDIVENNCFWFDCNENGEDDSRDIIFGISDDINDNGIPDECEDCNNNGTLDAAEITGGAPDVNDNGIPDECEDDCNGNGIPDEWETRMDLVADDNGNCVPDECDPDCNENGTPDFVEVFDQFSPNDIDNNGIPDDCQDCDGNAVSDWLDLEREFNLFVVDGSGFIREYHGTNGVPIQNIGEGILNIPFDCTFGPDRQLYITASADRVIRYDIEADTFNNFVSIGSGGLNSATFLIFGPDDNLYVSNLSNHEVLRFNGATGAFIDAFVSSGSGGLVAPYGLIFGPNGNLYVTSGNNSIIEYNGTTGAPVGTFVTAGSGGLSSPRGLAFAPDGHLLVASFGNSAILLYDGSTGNFLRQFSDSIYTEIKPWGIAVNRDGNVVAPRMPIMGDRDPQVYEYFYPSGMFYRRYVRDDPGLPTAYGLAFRPQSVNDADGNYILDICDHCTDTDGDGYGNPTDPDNTCVTDNCPDDYNPSQIDSDYDGIGDSCDICPFDPYNDIDNDGFCGDVDNCPTIPNDPAIDVDGDGVGDICDNCPENANKHQTDGDQDTVGDVCDNCPDSVNTDQEDKDLDDVGDLCDNCPDDANSDQSDIDGDMVGDLCDNCPEDYNPNQEDICSFICGDCNNDKTINILDITFLIAYLYSGGEPPESLWAADPNGDGDINILDISYIIAYLYMSGPEPICE